MNKVLLASDLHLHCHKRSQERLKDCLKVLDWIFDTAKKNNIKNILFGGDLFHDRQKIDVFTYQSVFESLKNNLEDDKCNLFLLLGNHDIWFNEQTSVSSVIPLSTLKNTKIISKPEKVLINDVYWDFIPFTHNPIESLKELNSSDYCLAHIAVDGAILHGNTISDVLIENDGDMVKVGPEIFKKYKHVFLGHYHQQQKLANNVEYIGSPLELSFGEAFQQKHIIIFDTNKNKCEYIVNDFSPKHLILKPEDKNKYNLENNFVRFYVEDISETDLISMRKEILAENNIGTLEIRQQKKKMDEHIITDAKAILYKEEEMLTKYVDQVGTNDLDYDTLIEIGKTICNKG